MGAFKALLNIGLRKGKTLEEYSPEKAIKAIEARGYTVEKAIVADDPKFYGPDGEPTLVVKLNKPLSEADGEGLALDLGQEAIPMKTGRKKNEGVMFGPNKDAWGDFNEDYFTTEAKYKNRHKPKKDSLDPLDWAGDRYPETTAPVRTYETNPKTGESKWYDSKVLSGEEHQVKKRRDAAQQRIKAGDYDPYFNIEERKHVPEGLYEFEDTAQVIPKTTKSQEEWAQIANDPKALEKLRQAYLQNKDEPLSKDWYAMGQLYDEFVKFHGPDQAPAAFKQDFADAMAATTGGADPQSNFLMAMYGNFLRKNNLPTPDAPNQLAHPIGGRYASGNMAKYDELINQGSGPTLNEPKRLDFSQAYRGDPNAFTFDEQMSSAYGLNSPPWYGSFTQAGRGLADEFGVNPRDFQDVSWAGIKSAKEQAKGREPFEGKPMMSFLNESVERTAAVTGKDPADIVQNHLVGGRGPMYGIAAATAGAGMLATGEEAEAAGVGRGLGRFGAAAVKKARNAAGEARRGGTDSETALNRIVAQMDQIAGLSGRQITENDRSRTLDELFQVYQGELERAGGKGYTGVGPKRSIPEEEVGVISGEREGNLYDLRVDRPYTSEEEKALTQMMGVEREMRQKPSEYQGNFGDPGPYFKDPYEPKFYSQKGKHGPVEEIPVKDGKALYGGGAAGGTLAIGDDEADPGGALAGSGVTDSGGRITGFLAEANEWKEGFMNFGEEVFADMGGSGLALASLVSDNLRGRPADYEKAKQWYNKISHGTELLSDDPSLENFKAADLLNDFAAQHPYVGGTLQGLMDSLGYAVDYLDVNKDKTPEWAHPLIYGTGAIF